MSKKDKKASKRELKQAIARRESFQEMLTIKDIANGCFVDEFGGYYPVVEIGNINFDLMSPDEKHKLMELLKITFSSFRVESYQILIVPMPFDIEKWIKQYSEKADYWKRREEEVRSQYHVATNEGGPKAFALYDEMEYCRSMQDFLYRQIQYNMKKVTEGGMTSKKSYFIPFIEDKKDIKNALESGLNFANSMRSIGIESRICSDLDLRVLLQVMLNPKNSELIKPDIAKSIPMRDEYLWKKED